MQQIYMYFNKLMHEIKIINIVSFLITPKTAEVICSMSYICTHHHTYVQYTIQMKSKLSTIIVPNFNIFY